jgi:DNA polymerase-3 subunit delta
MQLNNERLLSSLQKKLAPIYWIASDEALLVDEACSAVRATAQKAGYLERQVITVTPHFDWNTLLFNTQTLSLFNQQRLFELHFPSGKPGDAGSKALQAYANHLPPDTILLIITGKLPSNTQASRWYQAIDKVGIITQIWPIERTQMPSWLTQRLQQAGLKTTPEGISLLLEHVEGNLLAATQEIKKLQLLYGSGHLSTENIEAAIVDVARFDIFKCVDSALQGDALRTHRIINNLQREGIDATLLLWSLSRELRQLVRFAHGSLQGHSLDKLLQEQRVFEKRKPLYKRALARHSVQEWQELLIKAADIDEIIKGIRLGDAWDELQQLALCMAQDVSA